MGTKRPDAEAYPLCSKHHTERHSLAGPFKRFDKRMLRDYEDAQAQAYRRQYLGLGRDASLDF